MLLCAGYGGASSVSDLRQLADAHDSSITPTVKMSRNAETHKFHKLEAPARCRECDTQVYFDGVECSTVSGHLHIQYVPQAGIARLFACVCVLACVRVPSLVYTFCMCQCLLYVNVR